MVYCGLVDVCSQGWPFSLTDICPHWKLGSLSLEINILRSEECGIAVDITLRCWLPAPASSSSTTLGLTTAALSTVLLAPEEGCSGPWLLSSFSSCLNN